MARKKGSFSKKGNFIEFYGTAELLNKIEQAAGNVNKAVEKSLRESAELPKKDMKDFIRQHRDTGITEDSFVDDLVKWKGDRLELKTGFDIEKGGLPALFLDIGTPSHSGRSGSGLVTGIAPTFFIYYAVANNAEAIKQKQLETLNEILKGLTE